MNNLLTFLIDLVPDTKSRSYRFCFKLISNDNFVENDEENNFESPVTIEKIHNLITESVTEIEKLAALKTQKDRVRKKQFYNNIESLGNRLWEKLFPVQLQTIYWNKIHGKFNTLKFIISEELLSIPWELIRPHQYKNVPTKKIDPHFISEKFNLSFWLAGREDPLDLNLSPIKIFYMENQLSFARQEAETIEKYCEETEVSQSNEANPNLDSVLLSLKSNPPLNLHFICHGFNNQSTSDRAGIEFQDGELHPINISDQYCNFARQGNVIVFLNACQTANDGWIKAFVSDESDAECGCFIGASWSTRTESAYNFAITFYDNLLKGKTVSEAIKNSRQFTKEQYKDESDPTWLAYKVFCNPMARLVQFLS